ncbi:hypothetical protein [Caballeronia temeraria]|uniref:hypothetical protein n=1 Tax=Caballeronia temeraria TaxID=1777137 RepID=UPI001FC9C40F|nr:hypothetical protein [Caballeronia temeraria]
MERADDGFHRRRFREIIRKVVVDLGVREVAALFAQLDERAHLTLTLFILFGGHCDIGLYRAGLALPFVRPPARCLTRRRDDIQLRIFPIKTCHTFSSTGLLGDDRSPVASVTARDDFDDSFDHGRLAENRIEQSTQTACTRLLRFPIAQ